MAVAHSSLDVVGHVGPLLLLSHELVHSKLAWWPGTINGDKGRGILDVGRQIWLAVLHRKRETLTNTPSFSKFTEMFDRPTDVIVVQYATSVDCVVINGANVGFPNFRCPWCLPTWILPVFKGETGTQALRRTQSRLSPFVAHGRVVIKVRWGSQHRYSVVPCPQIWSWDVITRWLPILLYRCDRKCPIRAPTASIVIATVSAWP